MEVNLGNRTIFKFRFGDECYEVAKPTVQQVADFADGMKDITDVKSDLEVTNKWLVELGLPEKFLNSLEKDMYMTVIQTLTGQKKS